MRSHTNSSHSYEGLKKIDLESALDEHLRANQSTYAGERALSDYYARLDKRSPVKKEPAPSGDEAPVKKQRRKTRAPEEVAAATSSAMEEASNKASALVPKTPARQQLQRVAASVPLPPSPAVVTEQIERQTARIRSSLSKAYQDSGITEGVDSTRTFLSSAYTVQTLFTLVESIQLFRVIMPFKPAIAIPQVPYVVQNDYVASLPDVFQVLKPGFWGPLTLWSATSFILPALSAYFVNIAHSASTSSGPITRRATSAPQQVIDPLVFNITKALLIISVYYYHFDLLGATTNFTIEIVKQSVIGGELGLLTSAVVGGILSIYEAILRK